MSNKSRTVEQSYEECDWCGKEIFQGENAYRIHGDFPNVSVHEENCHRQAVGNGIRNKNQ